MQIQIQIGPVNYNITSTNYIEQRNHYLIYNMVKVYYSRPHYGSR